MKASFLREQGIVYVACYYDETQELPWDFVRSCKDGFEAVTTCYLEALGDDAIDEARQHLIGTYPDRDTAIKALYAWRQRVNAADTDGAFHFGNFYPKVHSIH